MRKYSSKQTLFWQTATTSVSRKTFSLDFFLAIGTIMASIFGDALCSGYHVAIHADDPGSRTGELFGQGVVWVPRKSVAIPTRRKLATPRNPRSRCVDKPPKISDWLSSLVSKTKQWSCCNMSDSRVDRHQETRLEKFEPYADQNRSEGIFKLFQNQLWTIGVFIRITGRMFPILKALLRPKIPKDTPSNWQIEWKTGFHAQFHQRDRHRYGY